MPDRSLRRARTASSELWELSSSSTCGGAVRTWRGFAIGTMQRSSSRSLRSCVGPVGRCSSSGRSTISVSEGPSTSWAGIPGTGPSSWSRSSRDWSTSRISCRLWTARSGSLRACSGSSVGGGLRLSAGSWSFASLGSHARSRASTGRYSKPLCPTAAAAVADGSRNLAVRYGDSGSCRVPPSAAQDETPPAIVACDGLSPAAAERGCGAGPRSGTLQGPRSAVGPPRAV